jgi:hypothetical protein
MVRTAHFAFVARFLTCPLAVSKDRTPFREDQFHDFVNEINHSLDRLELKLEVTRDQKTGQAIYSIVNLKGDAIAQMATEYTAAEIAYFKALVCGTTFCQLCRRSYIDTRLNKL